MNLNEVPKVVKLSSIRRAITTLNNAALIKSAVPFEADIMLYVNVPVAAINTKRKRKPVNRKPIKPKAD